MENQLAEEGEMNCTEEQVAQYNDAGSDFLKCIGMFHTERYYLVR
jgi:hypothetical protein